MRMSPDGEREVIEMLVSIEGSRSRTVRITGEGLVTKLGVGAVDLPDSKWLDILNRDAAGGLHYDTVETVRGGMVPLAKKALQGSDQTYSARGGATFGSGRLESPPEPGVAVTVDSDVAIGETMAWIVTDAKGKHLFVAPAAFNSRSLVEAMEETMHGEFMVEMLSTGSMTAGDEPASPGWRVLLEPRLHPDRMPPARP